MSEVETNDRAIEALQPLAYHQSVVDYFKRAEPEVWAWASSFTTQEEHRRETRESLLRDTYRLSADGHPGPYEACARAMRTLGIEAEATLYQAGGPSMNAALIYLPGEIHLLLQGPILERLSAAEFVALLGHELAHYRLWSMADGDFHTASRILDHTLADHTASTSHANTARLYNLHTELFADRGGAIVAGEPGPAITTLVKVQTGILEADAIGYLRQADELERGGGTLSQGVSHPEAYIRAQALDKWWRGEDGLDAWVLHRLQGDLALASLDLNGQSQLEVVTRRFIAKYLEDEAVRSEAVLTQVKTYFPDWTESEPALDLATFGQTQVADDVREYLGYVLLDLALVDPDLRDHALLRSAQTAKSMGSLDAFLANLKRDVGMTKREVEALGRRAKADA